jgi:hypothetical protein
MAEEGAISRVYAGIHYKITAEMRLAPCHADRQ